MAGIRYNLSAESSWRLRGLDGLMRTKDFLPALYAVVVSNCELNKILENGAEEEIARLRREFPCRKKTLEKIEAKYREKYYKTCNGLKLIDGVEKSLKILGKKYALGCVTNTDTDFTKQWIAKKGLDKYIGIVIGAQDVKNKKPDPEPIFRALECMGKSPSEAAYVGDTQDDIRAAKNAGCISIAVLSGAGSKRAVKNEGPDFIFKSLNDFARFINMDSA
jgi:HAD superfamily hydrolase (TIGR01549 family)